MLKMNDPSLTNIADYINLLISKSERNTNTLKGIIRPQQRHKNCPKCKEPFKHVEKIGYFCPECYTVPMKFFIDSVFWYEDQDVIGHLDIEKSKLRFKKTKYRIFSDKQGEALDSYQRALNLQSTISYEIENRIFDPSKYLYTDLKKFLFENIITDWIEFKKDEKRNTKGSINPDEDSYICGLKQYKRDYLLPFFKGNDVRVIKSRHLRKFLSSLPRRLKNKTKQNIMGALHNLFVWLHKTEERISEMPVFPEINIVKPDWEWLEVEDQDTLISGIPEGDRPAFKFQGRHGTRSGETRALRVRDFNFKRASVKIRRTFTGKSSNQIKEYTKNSDMREIPLDNDMVSELQKLCADKLPEAYVYVNHRTGNYYSKRAYGDIWRAARKAAGFEGVSCHEGTRHSFASQRVSKGADLRRVGDILGHKDNRTTDRIYSHTNVNALRAVMNINNVVDISQKKSDIKVTSDQYQAKK